MLWTACLMGLALAQMWALRWAAGLAAQLEVVPAVPRVVPWARVLEQLKSELKSA